MKQTDLVKSVAGKAGLSQADADKAIKAVIDTISEALVAGDEVTLNGLGKFSVSERAARTGRNPQTGATMEIAASKGVGFKSSSVVKNALNK